MENYLTLLSFGDQGWGDEIAWGVLITVSLALATLPIGLFIGFMIALVPLQGVCFGIFFGQLKKGLKLQDQRVKPVTRAVFHVPVPEWVWGWVGLICACRGERRDVR